MGINSWLMVSIVVFVLALTSTEIFAFVIKKAAVSDQIIHLPLFLRSVCAAPAVAYVLHEGGRWGCEGPLERDLSIHAVRRIHVRGWAAVFHHSLLFPLRPPYGLSCTQARNRQSGTHSIPCVGRISIFLLSMLARSYGGSSQSLGIAIIGLRIANGRIFGSFTVPVFSSKCAQNPARVPVGT
jgi:hypothetical protein